MKRASFTACVTTVLTLIAVYQSRVAAMQMADSTILASDLQVGDWVNLDEHKSGQWDITLVPALSDQPLTVYRKEQADLFDSLKSARLRLNELIESSQKLVVVNDVPGDGGRLVTVTKEGAEGRQAEIKALEQLVSKLELEQKTKFPAGELKAFEVAVVGKDFVKLTTGVRTLSIPHSATRRITRKPNGNAKRAVPVDNGKSGSRS